MLYRPFAALGYECQRGHTMIWHHVVNAVIASSSKRLHINDILSYNSRDAMRHRIHRIYAICSGAIEELSFEE